MLPRFKTLVMAMLCTLLVTSLKSQQNVLMGNSNYLSTESIYLNPASSVDAKTYIQVRFAGLSAATVNNAVGLKHFWVYGTNWSGLVHDTAYNLSKVMKFAWASATVEGPAVVVSRGNFGFGAFVRGRALADVQLGSMLTAASVFLQRSADASQVNVNLDRSRLGVMAWMEYGINGAYMFHKDRESIWAAGMNLRYLSGIGLGSVVMSSLHGYYNDSLINVQSMNGRLALAGPAINAGRGVGADIGVVYKKMLGNSSAYYANSVRCNCKNIPYLYKVGVTLRDFGYLRFNRQTTSGNVSGSGVYYTDRNDTSYKAPLNALENTTLSQRSVMATLPTMLVAQFDYNLQNHVYLNATWMTNVLPRGWTGARGVDLIALTGRFEFQDVEINVPFTLYRYMVPMLGLGVRYRTFAIGVDNLLPFVMRSKTYGGGIYASIGFSLFRNKACDKKKRKVDSCPTKILKRVMKS